MLQRFEGMTERYLHADLKCSGSGQSDIESDLTDSAPELFEARLGSERSGCLATVSLCVVQGTLDLSKDHGQIEIHRFEVIDLGRSLETMLQFPTGRCNLGKVAHTGLRSPVSKS